MAPVKVFNDFNGSIFILLAKYRKIVEYRIIFSNKKANKRLLPHPNVTRVAKDLKYFGIECFYLYPIILYIS